MPSSVAPEQYKFYRQNGYIEFENLLSIDDLQRLFNEIQKTIRECPGLKADQLGRSIPFLHKLVRRKQLGHIAYQLVEKKPLRLGLEQFFSSKPVLSEPLEEDSCGLLIYLKGEGKEGWGVFFRETLPENKLYKGSDASYLLLIFTAKPLSNDLHPIVYP